jgi:2-iminobutanoate/2-iminopropanoate deaminase
MKFFIGLIAILIFFGCEHQIPRKTVIKTDKAPAAIGPYSQAIKVGDHLYLAGQIAFNPETSQFIEGGIKEQTRQVLLNIQAVLSEAGYNFNDVVQTQIFLLDMNDYATVNKIYESYFEEAAPARAVVQVERLPKDALIEIMMVAVKT